MIDVIVVGAGASGLMAAIQAARSGSTVCVLEHMERPGKKLLMTGNGKCNFTNEQFFHLTDWQDESACSNYFHGACPAFVLPALRAFDIEQTLAFFKELGIVPVQRRGGYYPAGGQASGMLSVLLMECERLGVQLAFDIGIRAIQKQKKSDGTEYFVLETKTGTYQCRTCVLATGGTSYKKTGSDGSGFLYAQRLGHCLEPLLPALVPMQSELTFFKKTAGIRTEICAQLCIDDRVCAQEKGELQLTDYGLSGICMFQLSSLATRALSKKVVVQLDFLPDWSEQQVYELLEARFSHPCAAEKTAAQALLGLFADKLGRALLEEADLSPEMSCKKIKQKQLWRFVHTLKQFSVPISGTRSFEQAQVTAGGISTAEVCAETMESTLAVGLYFAGEMLDIDGICGGFNLQWAWSSGALAGRQAAASAARRKRL